MPWRFRSTIDSAISVALQDSPAVPRLFVVKRSQKIERDHQKVPGPARRIEQLQFTQRVRCRCDRLGRHRLRYVVLPVLFELALDRHQRVERHLARLALLSPRRAPRPQRLSHLIDVGVQPCFAHMASQVSPRLFWSSHSTM